jgi:uncharacterized membrane protein
MSNIKKTENRKVELEETPSGQIRRFEQESTFISPVPDPQTMAGYEAIQAGFADRFLKMSEKEQSERLDRERDKLNAEIEVKQADISLRKRGQWFGLGAVSLVVGLTSCAFYLGYKEQGATIATTVIVALAAIFVLQKFIPSKD